MKKGISLIVLIVTIIVIIILAAAVILTLNKNNPIDSSRVSQLADNRASLNSALQLYYGKTMAETQGIFTTEKIFMGSNADLNGSKVAIPRIVGKGLNANDTSDRYFVLTTKTGTNAPGSNSNPNGVATDKNANPIVNGVYSTEEIIDTALPGISKATWYVDVNTGLVYLAYTSADDLPSWMFTGEGNSKAIDTTLNTFVRVVKSGDLVDYATAKTN